METSPGNADVFCDMGYSFYLQRKYVDYRTFPPSDGTNLHKPFRGWFARRRLSAP